MTRDAEHTPSPQSVVVPVRGPGHCDDDAAWAEFVRQYDGQPRSRPDLTDFALANRVFMADRNDLDLIVWQTAAKERIRWLSIELAKAQAAPAPSSLAGGEVLDRFERAAFAKVQNLPRGAAARAEEIARRDAEYDAARNAILAALSPEAPARDGGKGPGGYLVKDFADGWYWTPNAALDHAGGAPVWSVSDACYETDPPALTPHHEAPAREGVDAHQTVGPIDYDKLRSIIHSATNAVLPFANAPMKTPFSTKERAGMQVEIADLIVADLEKAGGRAPALTPRHEAPSPTCQKCGGEIAGWCCQQCPAEFRENDAGVLIFDDEAPAEGAGEREAIARTLWISRGGINRLFDEGSEWKNGNGFEQRQQCLVDADAILALRARSSAPEAREGEAVAWRYKAKFSDLAHSHWHYTDRDPSAAKTITNVQPLYAAPSADKLRIAVEALEVAKRLAMTHAPLSVAPKIIKALAALKAGRA